MFTNDIKKGMRTRCETGEFDDLYASYITDHATGEYTIGNGKSLLFHMERGYLWNDFIDYMKIKLLTNKV